MGNTDGVVDIDVKLEDHPHIHGEHSIADKCKDKFLGSPPYTWGTHFIAWHKQGFSGITPIYMGNTLKQLLTMGNTQDHPHIHGEHLPKLSGAMQSIGSPPYTWGTLVKVTV